MNPVDKHIKSKMLQFPELYPSRWSVLEKMFLHLGSGYQWSSQGRLVWPDYRPDALVPDEIDVSDLDRQQADLNQLVGRPSAGLAQKVTQAGLDLERLFRGHVQRNIDLYVCTNLGGVSVSEQLIPATLTQTPLGQVLSLTCLQAPWSDAARETIGQLKRHFGHKLATHQSQLSKGYQDQLGLLLKELQAIELAVQRLQGRSKCSA